MGGDGVIMFVGIAMGITIGFIFAFFFDTALPCKPFIEKGIIKYAADEKTGKVKLIWADGTPFYKE